MTIIIGLALLGVLALFLLDSNWKAGIVITFIIGFLQDPLRKLTPDQPQWFTAFALLSFALTGVVLYFQRRGSFDLRQITCTSPKLNKWIPIFVLLIIFQSANSFIRFNDLYLTAVGASFYIVPLLGVWIGYHVGCSQKLLKNLIGLYLIISVFYAASVFLSYRGYPSPLLEEIGEGIEIVFRYGFHAQGATGLWRTSEIASFHLATAACISIAFAFSLRQSETQITTIVLALGFSFLTILTGRRKSLVLIAAFFAIFIILFSRRSSATLRERVFTSIVAAISLSYVLYVLVIAGTLGSDFSEYLDRARTTTSEITERLQTQGLGSTLRALEISDGIGLGVGVGANVDNLGINLQGLDFQSRAYVSEGGGGRIVLELGVPGIIVLIFFGINSIKLLFKNYKLLRYFRGTEYILLLGLFSYVLANLALFYSASQLYSDPFVLVLLSISFGTFLAIPTVLLQRLNHHDVLDVQNPLPRLNPTVNTG